MKHYYYEDDKIMLKRKYWNNKSVNIYDESIIQTNYGNFRTLLRFKSMADFILDKHLKNAISFATYILVPIFKMRLLTFAEI